jgi:hypothetical protein
MLWPGPRRALRYPGLDLSVETQGETMMARRWAIGTLTIALLLAPTVTWAVATLTFLSPPGGGGTLSYGGTDGVDPLVGTNILIGTVTGAGTPLESGTSLFCFPACELDFTTGANTLESPVYAWAAGGTFTLTGDLYTAPGGGGTQIVNDGTLISGAWTSPVAGVPALSTIVISGFGSDTKDPDLLAFFGITNTGFSFFDQEFASGFAPTGSGSFSGTVTSAAIINTASEPGTLLLMGLGLVGLGAAFRRRTGRPSVDLGAHG